MTPEAAIALFAGPLIGASLAWLGTLYWTTKKAKADAIAAQVVANQVMALRLQDMERQLGVVNLAAQRVPDLERQLGLVSLAVQPISAAFQAILIKELTHFHTPELDALLAKLDPFSLTAEEETEMNALLQARAIDLNGRIDDAERDAAMMLPMVIKRVRSDSTHTEEDSDIRVVGVPSDGEKKEDEEK